MNQLSRLTRLKRHPSKGQALAEFALVFPVLFLVIGGVIQFGMIFWGANTLNQIVRDAGRYAVTEPDCSGAQGNPGTGSIGDVEQKIRDIAANSNFGATLGTITITMPSSGSCPPHSAGDVVWLSIKVDAQVPVFFPFVPGNGQISSQGVFRMEPVP